ncbi:hypothetical protein AVEN_72271-1, partial [Araneus ventricosus]
MFVEIPCNMHSHLNSFFLSVFNRAKDEAAPQILCPLCQMVDLAVETNKMCGDCGKNFCQKCGTFVPGEGRIMAIVKYLAEESYSKRCVPILLLPAQGQSE